MTESLTPAPMPCLICGALPKVRERNEVTWSASCTDDTAHSVFAYGKDREQAIAAWNRRVIPTRETPPSYKMFDGTIVTATDALQHAVEMLEDRAKARHDPASMAAAKVLEALREQLTTPVSGEEAEAPTPAIRCEDCGREKPKTLAVGERCGTKCGGRFWPAASPPATATQREHPRNVICKCGHPRSEHLDAITHSRTPCMKAEAGKGMNCPCRKFAATSSSEGKP